MSVPLVDIFKYVLGVMSGLVALTACGLLLWELLSRRCAQITSTINCFYALVILHGVGESRFALQSMRSHNGNNTHTNDAHSRSTVHIEFHSG